MSWYRTAGTAPLFISGSELEPAIAIADAVKRLENFLLDGRRQEGRPAVFKTTGMPWQDLAIAAAAAKPVPRKSAIRR